MSDSSNIDYAVLDHPEILQFLFHPRPEMASAAYPSADSAGGPDGGDFLIPVAEGVDIGARFHMAEKTGANILFFHGNGEIVADYDELGPIYNQLGINFLAVDYRGYGRSTGRPTVSAMMQDCHVILEFTRSWLKQNNYAGPLILMGRSLGSASVLELAVAGQDAIDGLIVESGFAFAAPLLRLLARGVPVPGGVALALFVAHGGAVGEIEVLSALPPRVSGPRAQAP